MIEYNLSTEKWIQAIDLNGDNQYYSIEEILIHSHEIKEIVFASPIEEICIYRFLQAFFIIFTKAINSQSDWKKAFACKKFDDAKVKEYFELHREKFDLFNEKRPFYQHTDTMGAGKSPMILLFQDLSSNNNACLFDHSYNKEAAWIPLSRIAAGVIAQQAFVFGGGISKPTNFKGSTLSGSSIFWVKGENLYESLALNTPYLPTNARGMEMGIPAWESKLIASRDRVIDGYLDYLTFQSRRIKIEFPANISGKNYNPHTKEVLCSIDDKGFSISRCQGDSLKDANQEPLIALRFNEKENRHFPYKLRESRDVWRDSELLYTGYKSETKGMAPQNLNKLKYLKAENITDRKFYPINIYTVNNESGQPKIVMWRRSKMPYFPQLMNDSPVANERFEFIISLLDKAEKSSKLLYVAVYTFCRLLKHPKKDISIKPTGDDDKMIKKMTEKLNPEQDYWTALTANYYACLEQISELEDILKIQEVVDKFKVFTFITARNIFTKALYNAGNAKAYSIAFDTFNHKSKEDK